MMQVWEMWLRNNRLEAYLKIVPFNDVLQRILFSVILKIYTRRTRTLNVSRMI